MLLGSPSSMVQETAAKGIESMMIDEGAYSVLASATGAYLCRNPPIPTKWDSCKRPHVAVLCRESGRIQKFYLSHPVEDGSKHSKLVVEKLDKLGEGSIIEVKENNLNYSYYRCENGYWLKVAESSNPFFVEVFSHGSAPIRMRLQSSREPYLREMFT
ncbi:MAG: hypothetical protein GF309_05760 [Candidatus Lokiarchaeota archaeon]|nr:hypothetical protein [Candidatus Lokiarchaeota archaeon]